MCNCSNSSHRHWRLQVSSSRCKCDGFEKWYQHGSWCSCIRLEKKSTYDWHTRRNHTGVGVFKRNLQFYPLMDMIVEMDKLAQENIKDILVRSRHNMWSRNKLISESTLVWFYIPIKPAMSFFLCNCVIMVSVFLLLVLTIDHYIIMKLWCCTSHYC